MLFEPLNARCPRKRHKYLKKPAAESYRFVKAYESKYSRVDQVKFGGDSLQKIWRDFGESGLVG